jgi:hypothetical protein
LQKSVARNNRHRSGVARLALRRDRRLSSLDVFRIMLATNGSTPCPANRAE